MVSMLRAGLAASACALLTACAATSALESQSKPASAQSARIYILRPAALSGAAAAANVKIDGADVGYVANNSYFFVDRAAGRHKIEVRLSAALAGVEHEAQVEAGRTYYFAFNAAGATFPVAGVPITIPGPAGGRKVGEANLFSVGHLAEFDESAGAQEVARMTAAAKAQRAVRVGPGD